MNKPTLSIGITAFNEELNIKKLLTNLLKQNSKNYRLTKIIVVSDGSTDNTVKQVTSLKSKKIELVNFKTRGGMTDRLNYIFKNFNSDVLVKIDADVLPTNKNLLSEMVTPFIKNEAVGYVSGKLIAKSGSTFLEKSVNVSRLVWDSIKLDLKNGNSVYSCAGGIFALSREFAKEFQFPKDIWVDIGYLYFWSIKKGFKYISNKKAQVYFRSPSNLKDYERQFNRYGLEQKNLTNIFGKTIEKEYQIPWQMIYKYKFNFLIKYPFECLYLFMINFYLKNFHKPTIKHFGANWPISASTKKNL